MQNVFKVSQKSCPVRMFPISFNVSSVLLTTQFAERDRGQVSDLGSGSIIDQALFARAD